MLLDLDYRPLQGHVTYDGAYRVRSPTMPLKHWVACYWQLTVPRGTFSYHSVPDNCVDWIINLNCPGDNFIVPPFLSSVIFELTGPAQYFGIRFSLFGQQGWISVPVGEWAVTFAAVNAVELLHSQILDVVIESLAKSAWFDDRCNNLTLPLLALLKYDKVDPRLVRYVRYCLKNTTSKLDLSDKQCLEFGISARHLRRLSKLYLGLLPKDFARILRFQQTLQAMSTERHNAVWMSHYFDQSHCIREFKRLAGFTPTQFKNMSVLSNHQTSC